MDEHLKEIISRLATLEANQRHIMQALPRCEKHSVKEAVNLNRKLIYVIFASYLPLVYAIYLKIGG